MKETPKSPIYTHLAKHVDKLQAIAKAILDEGAFHHSAISVGLNISSGFRRVYSAPKPANAVSVDQDLYFYSEADRSSSGLTNGVYTVEAIDGDSIEVFNGDNENYTVSLSDLYPISPSSYDRFLLSLYVGDFTILGYESVPDTKDSVFVLSFLSFGEIYDLYFSKSAAGVLSPEPMGDSSEILDVDAQDNNGKLLSIISVALVGAKPFILPKPILNEIESKHFAQVLSEIDKV